MPKLVLDRKNHLRIRIGSWGLSSEIAAPCDADIWKGSAADLAARDAIAVYPIGGWWRENPSHQRGNSKVRYSLIVSLRTAEVAQLYTAIQAQIIPEITTET